MGFHNSTFAQDIHQFIPEAVESLRYSISLVLIGALAYVFLFQSREPSSIYSKYERVGNPWWVPKLFGKGPQTWFAEGYEKVKLQYPK